MEHGLEAEAQLASLLESPYKPERAVKLWGVAALIAVRYPQCSAPSQNCGVLLCCVEAPWLREGDKLGVGLEHLNLLSQTLNHLQAARGSVWMGPGEGPSETVQPGRTHLCP